MLLSFFAVPSPGLVLTSHSSSHTLPHTCLLHVGERQRALKTKLQASTLERAAPSPASGTRLGEALRPDFPVLHQQVNGQPLIYFDNAATSQKPLQVLQAMEEYYQQSNSNVHRGVHHLAGKATAAYEEARDKVAAFVGASSSRDIVWTKNATEGINLVAYSWGMNNLKTGDEILCSVAEHHSNLVPWQLVAQRTGATLRHVPIREDTQEIDMEAFHSMLSPKTKLVAMVHVSNMTGAILPAEQVAEAARKVGARVLLDCCQSTPHMPINVEQLGADWIVGSGHKMCGPTGIGFLWGRQELLNSMPPFQGGGEMIENVFLDHATYAPAPCRFEAGTPMIAEAVGLGAAVDYLTSLGMDNVHNHERELGGYLYERLSKVKRVRIYGPPPSRPRAALCAFNVEGIHATDISMFLDQDGVAVRSGHHCTQPLHQQLSIGASSRASLYIYNTAAEVDKFIESLESTIKIFD